MIGLIAGLVGFVALLIWPIHASAPRIGSMAAIAALMAVWWVSEAIPLAATALLPLLLFPLLGITTPGAVAATYINSTIFLFIGGFLIAIAMERCNLHRRLALNIVRFVGSGPRALVGGFTLASAFLSMWISNTATALMMLPIGMAVVGKVEEQVGGTKARPLATAMMLAIAYGCSVGGLATLIGTPPNLALRRIFNIGFPGAPKVTFGGWLVIGVPVAAVMLAVVILLLTRVFFRFDDELRVDPEIIAEERRRLGALEIDEAIVLIVFSITALLWTFRRPLPLGALTIPGWEQLLGGRLRVDDATVAIGMSLVLFLIPSRKRPGEGLLAVDSFRHVPWEIVLLFGGGFALAAGFEVSGLAKLIGEQLRAMSGVAPIAVVAAICLVMTFLTELTSNTATAQLVLPILASMAVAMQLHPLLLMIPATLSASCAFMLPVATPPNAVVFGSGRVRIGEMARVGLALNLIGVVVITGLLFALAAALGIAPGLTPTWLPH
ncbi:MAG: SLC13/DASS family transporter [Myxococcales bacterium]|nr:SLC13/DASS family transporter [Myxococcales bacterium]